MRFHKLLALPSGKISLATLEKSTINPPGKTPSDAHDWDLGTFLSFSSSV